MQGLTSAGPHSPEAYLTAGHRAAAGMSSRAGSSYATKKDAKVVWWHGLERTAKLSRSGHVSPPSKGTCSYPIPDGVDE